MFYMFGMLKFQVPEAEVIYLVKFFLLHITYLSLFLRCGHRSPWLEPITSAMLCYVMLCFTGNLYMQFYYFITNTVNFCNIHSF